MSFALLSFELLYGGGVALYSYSVPCHRASRMRNLIKFQYAPDLEIPQIRV